MKYQLISTLQRRLVRPANRSALLALTCSVLLCACGGNGAEVAVEPAVAAAQMPSPADAPQTSAGTPAPATVVTTPTTASTVEWRICATEYETCRLNGTRQVRYGLNGKYTYGTFSNSVSCTNEVFGDPLPGETKRCEAATTPTVASAPLPSPSVTSSPTPVPQATPVPVPAPAVVPVVAMMPAPAPTVATGATQGTLTTALSVAGMKADMIGAHESTIVGVPPAWSWGSAADPGFGLTGYPAGWTSPAYTMWGIVGPAASGSPATNVRVQIQHLRADFKRAGTWYRAQVEKTGFGGSNYTDYATNASTAADVLELGSEGLAVKVIQSGGHYHFYPSGRVPFPRDLQALVVSMDVRLVKDNPSGIDDIDSARIYGVAAGDIYQSMTASWNGTTWVNGHAPIGRFRQIGRTWRTITAHLGLATDAQFSEYIAWVATQPR